MDNKKLKTTLILIVASAVVCWAAWIIEIKFVVGWEGIQWLLAELISPYLVCFLVALCYMIPFGIEYGKIDPKILLTFLSLFTLNVTTYLLAEVTFKTLYTPSVTNISKTELGFLRFVHLAITVLFPLGYYFITHQLIMKISQKAIAVFMLCEALMFVLGVITNFIFKGYANTYGLIDSIKMGYPQFWICILMGLAGIYIVERYSEVEA